MKTIDEQLNIINDTKNGIAQVLNSKGVEVTADTKFADYPDKVAQLMGNAEVDASVSAALTEVTAEYLEQVNAVKAQADGLEESKLDVSVAEATYQPKGDYLTQHQDISGKLDASVAEATYQPKGDYLTQHQDISGKLDVSVAAETYATKQEVNSAGYLTQHQDISGKLDASVAEATYQPKGAYLTEHQDISGKLDASVAEATYQPKGAYLTEHQDISGKLDASVAAETYQPKGNYQPAGNYLTEHQDISGKLDASVAAETYQPKGAYLTEHQSLADYALKSELPLVPTNVSAFTNDAGYITQHQDISNLLDVSTAAATYATKDDTKIVVSYPVSHYGLKNTTMTFNKIVVDLHQDSATSAHGSTWPDAGSMERALFGTRGNPAMGSNGVQVWLDRYQPYMKVKNNGTLIENITVEGFEFTNDAENGFGVKAVITLPSEVTTTTSSWGIERNGDFDYVNTAFVLENTVKDYVDGKVASIDLSGKLDVSVAAETYATKAEVNSAGYLTSHQDISGKLDSSVAASTYATKSEIEGLGAETVTVTNVYGSSVDTEIVPQEMTSIVLKFNNSDMAPSDYVESFSSIKQTTIRIPMRSIYWENQDPTSAQAVSMTLWYNDTEEAWYVNPEGAGYIDEYANNYEGYTAWYDALPISQWFDRSHSWKPEGNNGSTYYKANFTAEFEVLSDDDYAYQFTITFDHKRNIICDADTTWFSEWRSQSVQRILAEELTMKQYVDGKFATVPTKTSDLTNDSSFISQHQDISGKLDSSVAAVTYQPIGNYLTAHQDISGKLDSSVAASTYATKSEFNAANTITEVSARSQLTSIENATATFDTIIIDFHSMTGDDKTNVSSHYYEDIWFQVNSHPLYESRTIKYGMRYNEDDSHWYTFANGSRIGRGVAGDGWLDMEHTWDPYEDGNHTYYRVAGNPTMTWSVDPENGVDVRATFEFETPVTGYINTEITATDKSETAEFYGTQTTTYTLKQKIAQLEAAITALQNA